MSRGCKLGLAEGSKESGLSAEAYNKALGEQAQLAQTGIATQSDRDKALAALLQSQELERLARKAGKYRPSAQPNQPDTFLKDLMGMINIGATIGKTAVGAPPV